MANLSCIPIPGEVFQKSEGYLEPSQASGVESFWENCWRLLFAKRLYRRSVLGSKSASGVVLLYSICVIRILAWPFWSSCPEVFCKKGVLRNFAKFTGKHLYQRLFFNKVAGLACNFIKKNLWHRYFPVNFVKFLRTPFFT